MEIVSRNGKETIRVPGGATGFPEKLVALQKALEAFDRAESDKVEDSYSYLLLATGSLVAGTKKKGDRRDAYEVVNDAISKYGDQAWAGGGKFDPEKIAKKHPLKSVSPEVNRALDSAEAYKSKSLEKAKKQIKARKKKGDENDPSPETPTPGGI